jgi:nitric oxide dioxygenase
VASPLHKQRFDLRTGRCLDDPDHSVRVWPVRVEAGVVQVARLPAVEQGTGLGHSGSNGHLNGHLNGQSNGLNGHGTGAERAVDPTGDRHMLTETDVKLVQDSFAEVLPIADEAAAMFYERLFEIAPEVQPLFSSDLTEQRRKLMMTIGIVVSGLHEYDELEEVVRQLGGRHAFDYGARPEHYPLVGEALLWTLGQGLGPAFTAELEAAWSAAYEMVTQTMLSAADDAVR